MTDGPVLADLLAARVRDVAGWPRPGVVFKDITPLLADPDCFTAAVDALAEAAASLRVDKVVGIEARGFIVAAPVACRMGAGFVPVRKAGKLPGPTFARSYSLEYAEATIEMHRDALAPGERVLIVDDVLATGGTVAAAVELIEEAGADAVGCKVLIELAFLEGRTRTGSLPVHSLLVY